MFKFLILSACLFSVVFTESVTLSTQSKQEKNVENYYIPPDNGGNYGDYLFKNRVPGDYLLAHEIQINPVSNQEQQINWNAYFQGRTITHLRFLNIGRQRAFVESASAVGSSAYAVIRVAPRLQYRLLIEVYGR